MPHMNKKSSARNGKLVQTKTKPKMNSKWIGKTLYQKKNPIQNCKTVKIRGKLLRVNKTPLARKRIFVQTPFSHSTLNLERKITPKNHSLFAALLVSA